MSTLVVTNISDGTISVPAKVLTEGGTKGWGAWDGTGTPALTDSYNVSSLTDAATGNFTLNWTNNMSAAAAYMAHGGAGAGDAANLEYWLHYPVSEVLAASLTCWVVSSGQIATDVDYNAMGATGDLA